MASQPPEPTLPTIGAQCRRCSDRWLELYAQHNGGQKYIWTGSSHSPHNTRLVKAFGPDEVIARMERYWASEYHRTKPGYLKFVNAWNELIDTPQPQTQVQKNLDSLARAAESLGTDRDRQTAEALAPLFAMPWRCDASDVAKQVYVRALCFYRKDTLERAVARVIETFKPSYHEPFPSPATITAAVNSTAPAYKQLPEPRTPAPDGLFELFQRERAKALAAHDRF